MDFLRGPNHIVQASRAYDTHAHICFCYRHILEESNVSKRHTGTTTPHHHQHQHRLYPPPPPPIPHLPAVLAIKTLPHISGWCGPRPISAPTARQTKSPAVCAFSHDESREGMKLTILMQQKRLRITIKKFEGEARPNPQSTMLFFLSRTNDTA